MTELLKKYFTNKKLSTDAKSLIDNYLSDKNIIIAIEYLTHDGYDSHGPESNLWDLYIIEEIYNNEFIIYNYHWEDWFRSKKYNKEKEFELTKYELYLHKNLCDANYYILTYLEKYINNIDSESLKNAFNLRKKELKK